MSPEERMLKRFALEQQVWGAVVPFGTEVEHKEKAVSQFTYAAVGTSPLGTAGGSSVPSLGWGGQRGSSLLQIAGRWINILTRLHGRQ